MSNHAPGFGDAPTSGSGAVPGVRRETVEPWLVANVAGCRAPFTMSLIAGGESNFTVLITDGTGRRVVLRRPPEGELLATAHDMLREARIMHDLHGTAVPVPEILATCDDPSVTGAPFYVMQHVEGVAMRNVPDMERSFPVDQRANACRCLVDTLAAIHGVDLDATGLGSLARREGYVERQLKRWRTQWESAGSPYTEVMDAVHRDLVSSMPASAGGPASLVHGDYRFDNTLVGPDGRVRAVIDWELSTLGDPLADLATTMVAWSGPGEAMTFGEPGPTSAQGCLSRSEAIAYYGTVSGRDVAQLPWYMAWAHWRVACILGGVYARNASGGGRGEHSTETYFADLVDRATKARRALDELGV